MNSIKNSKIFLVSTLGIIFILLIFTNISLNSESILKTPEMIRSQNSYKSSWIPNGTAICIENNSQNEPTICSDGTGGAIITWYDNRYGYNDIYAQKISTNGITQWVPNGTAICTASDQQFTPQICSDGAGGAIITWEDRRGGYGDIYVQRINSSGNVQWIPNGTPICTAAKNQYAPQICSDGGGGAIITWYDERSGNDYDIYAQRVGASGNVQWITDGVAICNVNKSQSSPQICSDGRGGAIITWHDERSEIGDIYSQRINSSGNIQWMPNGTAICTASDHQVAPQICSDGAGGAIIGWQDKRDGLYYDIYVQRINVNGDIQWESNGTAICTAVRGQYTPQICSDGAGGAIVTWYDYGNGGDRDIYVQRINSSGNVQWIPNGTPICTENDYQDNPTICCDGTGGAIIAWEDERNQNSDIYGQKINANGNIQWTTNGVPICSANGHQFRIQICSDGVGGAITAWMDERFGSYTDIYAQRIETVPLINVEISYQSFSSEIFNITILLSDNNEMTINFATIHAWWDSLDVSTQVQNREEGFYLISLDPIYISPGENPILLNMTISAEGYEDKYFETFIQVTKKKESIISGYNILLIIGLISVIIVVSRKLFTNKK